MRMQTRGFSKGVVAMVDGLSSVASHSRLSRRDVVFFYANRFTLYAPGECEGQSLKKDQVRRLWTLVWEMLTVPLRVTVWEMVRTAPSHLSK